MNGTLVVLCEILEEGVARTVYVDNGDTRPAHSSLQLVARSQGTR